MGRTSLVRRVMVSCVVEKHCASRAAHLAGTRMRESAPALCRISSAVGTTCTHGVAGFTFAEFASAGLPMLGAGRQSQCSTSFQPPSRTVHPHLHRGVHRATAAPSCSCHEGRRTMPF